MSPKAIRIRELHKAKKCSICRKPALGKGWRCKPCLEKDAQRKREKRAKNHDRCDVCYAEKDYSELVSVQFTHNIDQSKKEKDSYYFIVGHKGEQAHLYNQSFRGDACKECFNTHVGTAFRVKVE